MWETFPIQCQGGLVSNLPPIQQGLQVPGSATKLINFESSITGGYSRINGYAKWDQDPVPGTGQIFGVKFFDGDVITAREDKIFTSGQSGWTQIASGRAHEFKHRYTVFNFDGTRKVLGVDGKNAPYTWDKTTFTEILDPSVEGASIVTDFRDHIFFAVDDLLVFSAPFDEVDFTPANGAGTIRMPGAITGLIVFREQLFIFTANTISQLSGTSLDTFVLTSVATDIGCRNPCTIREVAADVVFLSADGVRLLSSTQRIGDFNNQLATKPIQKEINQFALDYTNYCSGVVRGKSQYRIFGWKQDQLRQSSVGYIGVQFEAQNPDSFEWSQTLGIKAYSLDSMVWNNREWLVFCSDTDYVYLMDEGETFDGEAISSSYWTPYLSISDPSLRKVIYKASLYFSPTTIIEGTLNLKFDLGDSSKIQPKAIPFELGGEGAQWNQEEWNDFKWAAVSNTKYDVQTVGSGKMVSLRFEFLSSSGKFNIDTILLQYSQEGRS